MLSPSRNPELALPIYAWPWLWHVPGTSLVAATVALGVERNLVLLVSDLAGVRAGRARWAKVLDAGDEVSSITSAGGWFYFKSSKGAPRYQVLSLPVTETTLARSQVLVPQAQGVIGDIAAARDGLYFTRRDGVNARLGHVASGAAERAVALPDRKSTRLNSSHERLSRMPSSA